jgi:aminoglycoside phosphotransferase (APT) family kinase protein
MARSAPARLSAAVQTFRADRPMPGMLSCPHPAPSDHRPPDPEKLAMPRALEDHAALIRRLIDDHLPGRRVRTITPLGAGLENAAFDVDGDLVVRFRADPDPAERTRAVEHERRLLGLVATRSPLPVPMPVLALTDEGCLIYPRLPGRPLIDLPAVERSVHAAGVGTALGGLLAALHSTPREHLAGLVDVDDTAPAEWLDETQGLYADLGTAIPARYRPAVRAFLDAPPPDPAERLLFSHNDLGIKHVLVDPGTCRITGILDWADAATCDPARDLSLILRDLGPQALDAALTSYAVTPEHASGLRRRIGFLARCALLEDLAYGLDTGSNAYVEKSLHAMEWLFPV